MEKQDCDIQETNHAGNACLYEGATNFGGWEYARKGDYHRKLDPNWSYTPTYLRKMHYVRSFFRVAQKRRVSPALQTCNLSHPARVRWLHDVLERFAMPSLSILNLFWCRE